MVAILSAVRLAVGKQDIAGVPLALFFATGIVPYYFFQTNISQSLNVIQNNLGLMNYKVVKPADPVLAKCILELLIYSTTGIILVVALSSIGFAFEWNNTLGVIIVTCCLVALTLGLTLITTVIGAFIR